MSLKAAVVWGPPLLPAHLCQGQWRDLAQVLHAFGIWPWLWMWVEAREAASPAFPFRNLRAMEVTSPSFYGRRS